MTASKLIQWAGIALILSGISFALSYLTHPVEEPLSILAAGAGTFAHAIGILALVFGQLGLIGLYSLIRERTGWFGLISFLLAFIGSNFMTGVWYFTAYAEPLFAKHSPNLFDASGPLETGIIPLTFAFSLIPMALGYILMGINLVRVRVQPIWSGIVLALGFALIAPANAGAVSFVVGQVGSLLIALALIVLGYKFWSEKLKAA